MAVEPGCCILMKRMPHKYQSTIDIMKTVIHKLPCVFPEDRHAAMESAIAGFERDPQASLEDIEAKLIEFGSELWPYSEAHAAFHKIYGAAKEKELMKKNLSPTAKKELERYIEGGGDIESVGEGEKFEAFFTPEVQSELVEAEVSAHDAVHEEMEKLLSSDKRADFDALLKNYQEKFAVISGKIRELETLAARFPQYAPEILDKAKTFREGFAYIERPVSLDDVEREIQYYIDVAE